MLYFSPEKFKSKEEVEKTTSNWFCHKDVKNKRAEISQLILQSSRASRLDERILPASNLILETERKNKKEPLAPLKSPKDMKLSELQEALKARGLPKSGRKGDLVARLESSLKGEVQPLTSSQNGPLKRKFSLEILPNKKK